MGGAKNNFGGAFAPPLPPPGAATECELGKSGVKQWQ